MIEECKFVVLDRHAQLVLLLQTAPYVLTQFTGIEFIAVSAIFLGEIQGFIGPVDQIFSSFSIHGIDADADAGADDLIVAIQMMGLGEGVKKFLGNQSGALGALHIHQREDIFISGIARHRVHVTNATRQAVGNGFQHLIAKFMPQGIVDVFESIEIKEQYGQFLMMTLGLSQRLLQPVKKQGSIGKVGDEISMGKAFKLFFHQLAIRNITDDRLDGGFTLKVCWHHTDFSIK